MHSLYEIFAEFLNICKQVVGNLVDESGYVPRKGVVPRFSNLEILALNMISEVVDINNESLLFAKLLGYKFKIPNLISHRQYNDRRKIISFLCNTNWERMATEMDWGRIFFALIRS